MSDNKQPEYNRQGVWWKDSDNALTKHQQSNTVEKLQEFWTKKKAFCVELQLLIQSSISINFNKLNYVHNVGKKM